MITAARGTLSPMIGFTDGANAGDVHAEVRRLRALVLAVAEDLERIALHEQFAPHVRPLQERAMRLRRHLHSSPL
jgi:hypothetical protein